MRRSMGALRYNLPRIFSLTLLLFLILSTLLTWQGRGGEDTILTVELPAVNREHLRSASLPAGSVKEPEIPASAAFLLDTSTGEVLYEKNPDLELPMASTTKIMTALVTLENASLKEQVVISERAQRTGESSAWLEKGEVLTVDQLLHALMVQSANDSAVALAEHVGGSVEGFVAMMNEKALALGATHTRFANPHGLDQEGHYTTARDLATMAACAMRNPIFRELVVSDGYEIPWPGHPYPRVMVNHNRFLKIYPQATGIKTGYTSRAGKCLVASAIRDGRELISVILNGGESYWDQTVQLMDYGFNAFTQVKFASAGELLASVEVGDFPRRKVDLVPSADLIFTVRKDRLSSYMEAEVTCPRWVPYPVDKGREMGELTTGEGGAGEKRETLVASQPCRPPNPIIRFFAFLGSMLGMWWRWIRWLIPGL